MPLMQILIPFLMFLAIAKKYNLQAFYAVENVRFVAEQHLFPVKDSAKNLF
jgi:hypothetical protein